MISCGACQQSLWDGSRIFTLVRPPGSALAAVRNPSNTHPRFRLRLQFSPAVVLASLPPRYSTLTLPASRRASDANPSSRLFPARSTPWGRSYEPQSVRPTTIPIPTVC